MRNYNMYVNSNKAGIKTGIDNVINKFTNKGLDDLLLVLSYYTNQQYAKIIKNYSDLGLDEGATFEAITSRMPENSIAFLDVGTGDKGFPTKNGGKVIIISSNFYEGNYYKALPLFSFYTDFDTQSIYISVYNGKGDTFTWQPLAANIPITISDNFNASAVNFVQNGNYVNAMITCVPKTNISAGQTIALGTIGTLQVPLQAIRMEVSSFYDVVVNGNTIYIDTKIEIPTSKSLYINVGWSCVNHY